MEIKKKAKGWEYDGIIFRGEASAKKAKEANERADDTIVQTNADAVLVYDSDRPTSFGQFVVPILKANGWSVTGFAERVEVTKQAFHSWINGNSVPHKKAIDRLVELTGVTRKGVLAALATNFQKHATDLTGTSDEDYGEVINGSGKMAPVGKAARSKSS